MLSNGQKLSIYRARRVHVSDIQEPLVKCLWWRAWEKQNAEIMADCRSMPSEFGHLMDAAEREVKYAREARAKILTDLQVVRGLERTAFSLSQNAVTHKHSEAA